MFGHTEFRGKQQDVIEAAIAGMKIPSGSAYGIISLGIRARCFCIGSNRNGKGAILVSYGCILSLRFTEFVFPVASCDHGKRSNFSNISPLW